MDWFERITGFREADYAQTRARLDIQDGRLVSTSSPRRCAVGDLETPTLAELRGRLAVEENEGGSPARLRFDNADVRTLHAREDCQGALFQVASQFNLLEMIGPDVSPEDGVTRYEHDGTQGPACAMAAGAATIYRNYFAPVGSQLGQTTGRQIDCLEDIGQALGNIDERLWSMRNGYALCTSEGLADIDASLATMKEDELDDLRSRLRIGLHWRVEVTDCPGDERRVSQAFCSALPVAYSGIASPRWARFATLVLEAAYEATLTAAQLNHRETGHRAVYLTRPGRRRLRQRPGLDRTGLEPRAQAFSKRRPRHRAGDTRRTVGGDAAHLSAGLTTRGCQTRDEGRRQGTPRRRVTP